MSLGKKLHERSGSVCELCEATGELVIYTVLPGSTDVDKNILLCTTCSDNISNPSKIDTNHWRCLNTSVWSTAPAVQVVAWRLLSALRQERWSQDLLDTLYLDEETLAWAKADLEPQRAAEEKVVHKDCNGTVLLAGDSVVLIKDLDVKGGGFTAKRGTAVRGIALVEDDAAQIEGRVNGRQIVILTQFVKRST